MTALSKHLDDRVVRDLRHACQQDMFPGVTFEQAMAFLLTDGILPQDDLPVDSFLKLETWVRGQRKHSRSFSATELKNKTGLIIETVLRGNEVVIHRHGKPIVMMHPIQEK